MKQKLKIGDRVMVAFEKTIKGMITRGCDQWGYCDVALDIHRDHPNSELMLERYHETDLIWIADSQYQIPVVQIGDRARIIDPADRYVGCVVTIIGGGDAHGWSVRFASNRVMHYAGQKLTKIPAGQQLQLSKDPLDIQHDGISLRVLLDMNRDANRESPSSAYSRESLTSKQRAAVSAHWSAELRAKIAVGRKPILTIMSEIDPEDL